ncbi:MAG: hypothetical protein AMXMBFR7_51020 [Planctomycetota bacterium]
MPIDTTSEDLLSLTDASKALPKLDGKRAHVSTLWRWCRKGVRGVQLEYVRFGNRICTSREALDRFANRLAEADKLPREPRPYTRRLPGTRSAKEREVAIRQAEEDLRRHGI